MIEPLTALHQRVLGSLVEKEATVPDTYPMTRKALTAACNQRSSRDPVTDHDESTVQTALDELKAAGLVRFVYASHGARSTRYRHVLDERLGLDPGEAALVAVLLLRGPQTLNELRVRTERAHAFADNDEVAASLAGLAGRDEPVVTELARQSGQKETRWIHLLGPLAAPDAPATTVPAPTQPAEVPSRGVADAVGPTVEGDGGGLAARVAELEQRVAALESLLTEPDHPGSDDAQEHSR